MSPHWRVISVNSDKTTHFKCKSGNIYIIEFLISAWFQIIYVAHNDIICLISTLITWAWPSQSHETHEGKRWARKLYSFSPVISLSTISQRCLVPDMNMWEAGWRWNRPLLLSFISFMRIWMRWAGRLMSVGLWIQTQDHTCSLVCLFAGCMMLR